MKLIGIAGQAGAGKNALADYLLQKLNKDEKWVLGSFADNVKRIFCDTFGVSRDFIEHWKRIDECPPGFDMPIRQCLTFIGDGFRNICPTIWMDLLLNNRKDNLCLSDARYLNEILRIRKEGGINILLWRYGFENEIPNASEQEFRPIINDLKNKEEGVLKDHQFDIFIKNNGDLDQLYAKADKIILPFIRKKLS